jgi:superfamily II DNA helicase RecQ
MLETPAFAKVLRAESFRAQLSGVYIDEAHSLAESLSWRLSYSRLHLLRAAIGTAIPLICLSATLPERYRKSLIAHAGLRPEYKLINLGNHRPELTLAVIPMQNDASSFLDLQFVLPTGTTRDTLQSTIIYADDLELLTSMFWWFHSRLSSMQLPPSMVDILHAGLSEAHQKKCIDDFRNEEVRILLGSDKIGATANIVFSKTGSGI